MESLGYKQKNKMVYQMIENMKAKSIDFDQFLDMMTARIVSGHAETATAATKLAARLGSDPEPRQGGRCYDGGEAHGSQQRQMWRRWQANKLRAVD